MTQICSKGSIFDSGAEIIINPINCVGIMGAGLALEFNRRYPIMNNVYKRMCHRKLIQLGKVWVWHEHEGPCGIEPCRYIVNFPTKDHWRDRSQLKWIAEGLDDFKNHSEILNAKSIAIPALGCGFGGLSFDNVRALVVDRFKEDKRKISLFTPRS